jgi:hypothetical protein
VSMIYIVRQCKHTYVCLYVYAMCIDLKRIRMHIINKIFFSKSLTSLSPYTTHVTRKLILLVLALCFSFTFPRYVCGSTSITSA